MSGVADYEVGYRRPPVTGQFTPGRSGNPSGRPKGARNVSTVIDAALSEKVTVIQNGKRRSITKLEAAFTQMANKAASGDRQAVKLMIELLHQSQTRDDAQVAASPIGADERRASDAAILAAVRQSALNIVAEDVGDDNVA